MATTCKIPYSILITFHSSEITAENIESALATAENPWYGQHIVPDHYFKVWLNKNDLHLWMLHFDFEYWTTERDNNVWIESIYENKCRTYLTR